MTIYLNIKKEGLTETIDQVNSEDFKRLRDFYKEVRRLKSEYRLASNWYSGIYSSQRCCKDWN